MYLKHTFFNLLRFFYILIFFSELLEAAVNDKEKIAGRIHAHLSLHDPLSASIEAQNGLSIYPQSKLLLEGLIRATARLGNEQKTLQLWQKYTDFFPDQSLNRELIEEMAWGVVNKAFYSPSLVMRQISLLAACFSQEGKGVSILHKGMRDSNHAIRETAVELAGHFRDRKLKEEIKRLFATEKVWSIRQHLIQAIGKMHIVEMQETLEKIVAEESHPREKKAAITALLQMFEVLNRTDVERLVNSNRSGLRALACQAIAFFQSNRDFDVLVPLLKDPQADVRIEAYQTMGLLGSEKINENILDLIRRGVFEVNTHVGLSAAWLLTLYKPDEGMAAFQSFFSHKRQSVRLLAAAALNATGQKGLSFALRQFRTHEDPFVRLNLAIGLIGQRVAVNEASAFIRSMLMTDKEKWSMSKLGLFQAISNKNFSQIEDSEITPEMENLFIRLELLNLLAIIKEPYAQDAIKDFLKERLWGITTAASAFLLTEGDETAIDIVKKLLEDSQHRIRLQGALILSLWGKEEDAIRILKEEYPGSDFEMKGRILESLGRIGSEETIPFLINIWKEPSQTLRVIAAMSIIQCLYH